MKNVTRRLKQNVRGRISSLAYSEPTRRMARTVLASPSDARLRRIVEERGLEGTARRLASEALPPGTYFAKLTIDNWEKFRNRSFRLEQNGKVVYGNKIEPPARGYPLEYRNIIVTSKNLRDFKLSIKTPYKLQIGQGAFSTPQQVKYDEQYGVTQHGDVFYSVRGNTKNPTKLLLTFPGFGPSTSRISYAVSYLKAITDTDLKDTLMVCFQDRYQVAGSYMMVDNAGRPLYDRVHQVIEGLRNKHGIDPENILFFGASKGGSIALHYAREYPAAHLLLAVPQMHLPYYFNKPFFKQNLFQVRALHEIEQPQSLLRRYLAEGRKIDYFYTNSDELSNHSLIELAQDVPGLTKYRFDGVHGAVARAALPATLGIIRRFLGKGSDKDLTCDDVYSYVDETSTRVQVRVQDAKGLAKGANWFIAGNQGRSRFLQVLTSHSYDFLKYSSNSQRLFPYDKLSQLDSVVAMDDSGDLWQAALPAGVKGPADQDLPWGPIVLDTGSETQEHVILNGDVFGQFCYRAKPVGVGDTIEVHVVDDPGAEDLDELAARAPAGTSHVVCVQSLADGVYLHLMLLRLVMAADAANLRAIVRSSEAGADWVTRAARVAWKSAVVEVHAPTQLNEDEPGADRLQRLVESGRVVLV